MVFWITVSALSVLLGISIVLHWRAWDTYGESFDRLAMFFSAITLIGAVVAFMGEMATISYAPNSYNAIISASRYSYRTVATEKLQALGNGQNTSGQFYFLGGGYVGAHQEFEYIVKEPGGTFALGQKLASLSRVHEITSGSPHLVIRDVMYKDLQFWPWTSDTDVRVYDFYVPKGSVETGFNVSVSGGK